jgi:hypothetical protein
LRSHSRWRYLDDLAALSFPGCQIDALRRYAAARLVQWVTGGSMA